MGDNIDPILFQSGQWNGWPVHNRHRVPWNPMAGNTENLIQPVPPSLNFDNGWDQVGLSRPSVPIFPIKHHMNGVQTIYHKNKLHYIHT